MKAEFIKILENDYAEVFSKIEDPFQWVIVLRSVFSSLRKAGLTKEDLTEENIDYMAGVVGLKIHKKWVIKQIEYISKKIDLEPKPVVVPKKEKIEEEYEEGQTLINLKPSDFKDKVIDWEFLKLIGAENPDE